jgi:transketolase
MQLNCIYNNKNFYHTNRIFDQYATLILMPFNHNSHKSKSENFYPKPDLSQYDLAYRANQIRKAVIQMIYEAGSGHPAGALGMADVFTALYFSIAKHTPDNPNWIDRDRVLVSNGHICPVWYATLSATGYFPESELKTLRKINSRLQGHPHLGSLPGIENTGGPLGQGLSQGAGLATAWKIDQSNQRVFVVLSDGELQEGQTWEAYMYAGARKLNNLTALIDRNKIQIDGYTHQVMPLEPLKAKLEAFNWSVLSIDGNDLLQIIEACLQAQNNFDQPTAVICNTIPGKGVSFMENLPEWHGQAPDSKQTWQALKQLNNDYNTQL